jgi:hypothetical protein
MNLSISRCRRAVAFSVLILSVSGLQSFAAAPDSQWKVLEEAHEIINIGNVLMGDPELPVSTYKSGGTNPVPDELWPEYTLDLPYIKNTTRNLQFNESLFIASPGEPIGTTTYVSTSDEYTWAAMSTAINAMWPYRPEDYTDPASQINAYYAGNFTETPPEGVVKVTTNFKAQDMKFWANENGARSGTPGAVPLDRYFVEDQWGNLYVMHASGKLNAEDVADAFVAAVLPAGWTKSVRQLKKDLILYPAQGSDGSFHYLVFRDSADNTYHQVGWSGRGSLQAQVDGMPIWGGQRADTVSGDADGIRSDLIHGAAGNDLIRPGYGTDDVWCDAGVDTVVLDGRKSQWEVVKHTDSTTYELSGPAGIKTIHACELLQFDDAQTAVATLRNKPASAGVRN